MDRGGVKSASFSFALLYHHSDIMVSRTEQEGTHMTIKEVREEIKKTIIAQGGKLYNFNINNIRKVYGVDGTTIQNAINYFQFSPQQAKFRATYNFH